MSIALSMDWAAPSRPEQPRVLGFVPHTGDVGAECRAAEIIKRSRQRAFRGVSHDRLERRKNALTVGLSERDQPRAGRYPVRSHRMKESVNHGLQRNTMRGADKADRDRIDD